MASLDRLVKALDSLRTSDSTPAAAPTAAAGGGSSSGDLGSSLRSSLTDLRPSALLFRQRDTAAVTLSSADKKLCCRHLADGLVRAPVRGNAELLQSHLPAVVETMMQLVDDTDADVRTAADENINRIIRGMSESNIGRLLVELFRVIKLNGAARSMCAALSKFSQLAHRIRPQKRRAYVVNLFPCLLRLSQRWEVAVQECLSSAIVRLAPVLGVFFTDPEVKTLLRAFLPNLAHSTATLRRSASQAIIAIVGSCRKHDIFVPWLLATLVDCVSPTDAEPPLGCVLGALLCLRDLVPMMEEHGDGLELDRMLQLLELLLHFALHVNHNVVTAALDALCQLIRSPSAELLAALVSPGVISRSYLQPVDSLQHHQPLSKTPSVLSVVAPSIGDDTPHQQLIEPDIWPTAVQHTPLAVSPQSQTAYREDGQLQDGDATDEANQIVRSSDEVVFRNLHSSASEDVDSSVSHPSEDAVLLVGTPPKDDVIDPLRYCLGRIGEDSLSSGVLENQPLMEEPVADCTLRSGDIGSLTDSGVALVHCCRLLASQFLLTGVPGTLRSDRDVRVSVKVLGLNCIAAVIALVPDTLALPLHIDSDSSDVECQYLYDVFSFSTDPDPQLRGSVAILCGTYLRSWTLQRNSEPPSEQLAPTALVYMLKQLLSDSSHVTARQALEAVGACVPPLLSSCHAHLLPGLLLPLFSLADNSYWLVKIGLCALVGSLPLAELEVVWAAATGYSDSCLHQLLLGLLLQLLEDADQRVQLAAAQAVAQYTARLPKAAALHGGASSAVDATALCVDACAHARLDLLPSSASVWGSGLHGVSSASRRSATSVEEPAGDSRVSFSLCVVVDRLVNALLASLDSRQTVVGYLSAMRVLMERYPATVYPDAWQLCHTKQRRTLYHLCLSMLTFTNHLHDLISHRNLIYLSAHLAAGLCVHQRRQSSASPAQAAGSTADPAATICSNDPTTDAAAGEDQLLASWDLVEPLFIHLLRVACVYTHLVEETVPTPPAPPKPSLPNFPSPSALSPIRRRTSAEPPAVASPIAVAQPVDRPATPDRPEKDAEKKTKPSIGFFLSSPEYLKFYHTMKTIYGTYKMTLNAQSTHKLLDLLNDCLTGLAVVLELLGAATVAPLADELLDYLNSLIAIAPAASLHCTLQLLRAMFGRSAAVGGRDGVSDLSNSSTAAVPPRDTSDQHTSCSLYEVCINGPYVQFVAAVALQRRLTSSSSESTAGPQPECDVGHPASSTNRNADKQSLTSYIRLFEPAVIKALKLYTVTSEAPVQRQVLWLLVQLVQLRVNYCLLDADQIFIGYVIKQLEYVEEGQMKEGSEIVAAVFSFLMLLSYERYHSKTVVSVPKILQLCEGLIASGLSPELYALPALRPIMEDLYMTPRSSVQDSEELDTQREVLFSMLLRLIHYSTTLDLCVVVLCECRRGQGGNDDRWRLASRQLLDALLPALERLAVQLDSAAGLTSLHRLLAAVCPRALRPAEDVLSPMLQPPPDAASVSELQRWGGRLCALLRLLVTQVREDVLLSRLEDLGVAGEAVTAVASEDGGQDPESRTVTPPEILVRFLLSSVELLATQLSSVSASPLMVNTPTYLPAILAQILQAFTYIIQSGSFAECARCAVWLLRGPSPLYDVRPTCDAFVSLRHCHPLLVLGWCNLLTLLGYSRLDYWRHLLQLPSVSTSEGSVAGAISLPMTIVTKGALILICDYLCEDSSDGELLAWLLTDNISELLQLASEPPVSDLLAALHRNPSASGLLIQSVATRCLCMQQPLMAHRALRCLEGTPVSQYGPLLLLLSQRLMSSCHLVVADEAVQLACRKMEIVIAAEDRLISEDDFSELVDNISKLNNLYRQKRLVELVTQIGDKLFGMSVQLLPPPPAWSLGEAEVDAPDYRWFCQLVSRCCAWRPAPAADCAQLLAKLDRSDMESVLNSVSTDSAVLAQCFTVADAITRTQQFESPLYCVAESVFQKQLTKLCQLFPSPDNAFATDRYRKYNRLLESALADSTLWERLITCCQTATAYLETRHVPRANRHLQPAAGLATPMARLTLLALEAAWFSVAPRRSARPHDLRALLSAAGAGLRFGSVSAGLARHDYQWTALTVNAIYKLVQTLVGALPDPAVTMVARVPDIRMYQRIASLIIWAENERDLQETAATLKSIVVSVGRLPLLSSFLRVPPDVYQQHGHQLAAAGGAWSQEAAVTSCPSVEYSRDARFSPVPVQSLQEADVLRQYISRVNLMGWCDRREFEETWMTYLSVLNASAEDSTAVSEEQAVLMQTNCLAVRGITSLLLQTMTSMVPGHPGVGAILHHPRDLKPIFIPGSVISHFDQFLLELQTAVESCSLLSPSVASGSVELSARQLNVDRRQDSWLFGHGQVSLRYLRMVISGREGVHSSRDQVLEAAGLDINSCVVFLLQLYEQWLGPGMSLALPLLTETVRSAVLLSDLMTERGQYEWLLARCSALYQLHPVDDEIMLPYLVLGLCKSAAVLDACDGAVLETVRRAVEHGLRCTLPPVRISTLHGCLYLLQLGPGQLSSSVLPCLTDFLQHNLSVISTLPGHNDDYDLAVWAVALYIIQHYDDGLAGQSDISPQLLQHAYSLAAATRSPALYEALMKGIEQLVVCGTVSGAAGPMRLSLEQVRLQHGTGVRLLWAVSLLFACLFAAPVHQQLDAESHVQVLETYSTLLNKLKTVPGYMADILCSSMTAGVLRLCPPAEMMNKVIAEFISPNQLHPRAMASAIFKVFEWCALENQRPLLQDWVLFSVPNFTSCPVLPRATWQLTCFLLAASCSCWLRAAFPLLLRCSYDFESMFSAVHLSQLFVIAARDFYQQISESQREQFIAAVQQPASSGDLMYQRLLRSITDGSSGIASPEDTSG